MRLLTIQLLLLGTQLISAAPDCDKTYIKGALPKDYQYPSNGKLTCNGDKEIEVEGDNVNGKRYSSLDCNTATGWTNAGNPLDPVKSATDDITIACIPKACDESLIDKVDANMEYKSDELKCKAGFNILEYSFAGGAKKRANKLKCDKGKNKWLADGQDTTKKSTDPVTVTCEKTPCHKSFMKITNGKLTGKTVTCDDPKKVHIGTEYYQSVTCDEVKGWSPPGGTPVLAPSTAQIIGACDVAPPPACTTSLQPAQITEVNGKHTCSGQLKALQVGSEMHLWLTCDGSKWTSPAGLMSDPVDTPLQVTCVDYCQITGVNPTVSGGSATVKCNQNDALYYTDSANEKKRADGDSLTCSFDQKWKSGTEEITKDVKTALAVECVAACSTIKNGLPTEAKKLPTDVPDKHVFKCDNVEGKKGIMLNGNLVNSNLYCDATTGYYDIANNKLADAFEEVTISCGKSNCEGKVQRQPCNANPVPEGYLCDDQKRSPELQSDDFNFLQCNKDKTDNLKLYLKDTDKFLDDPLQCEGDNFYKYGDATKTPIATTSSSLICLQKHCSICPKIPATGGGPPANNVFTEGSSDACATAKCPSDLWMVTRDGETTSEEYVGEVQCSSVASTRTKWLISRDEPTPISIREASCIPAIPASSCIKAAPLNIDCEDSWKERGCDAIIVKKDTGIDGDGDPPRAPSEDTNRVNTCNDGLHMFYKQPNDGYALNEKPADNMVCTTKGWELTFDADPTNTVILQSGATIVCAKENPSPVTTTAAPTTTTPFVAPCEVCPKGDDVLYSCDKCSTKKPSFDPTSDNEKCQATDVASEVTFETEKAGLVKGKLVCDKTEKIWKTEDGAEVGKFAIPNPGDSETAENTGLIIGGAVGGVVFLIAILAVIFYVLVGRKKRPNEQDEDTKRKMLEEGKKKKKTKDGDNNDEILDEVAVDAPAEIKL